MPVEIAVLNTSSPYGSDFLSDADAAEGKPPFVPIPPHQFQIAKALWECVPDIRTAFEAISRGLFAGNVIVTGVKLTERQERQVQHTYVPMMNKCIRDLLCYGFVLVTINRKTKLPYVIPPTLVRVDFRTGIGGPNEYRIMPCAENRGAYLMAVDPAPMDDILVFEMCAPDEGGNLTSAITSLLSSEVFRQSIRNNAAIAYRAMSNPGIFTESKEASLADKMQQRDFTNIGESEALAVHHADVIEQMRALRERHQLAIRANAFAEATGNGTHGLGRDAGRRSVFGAGSKLRFDPVTRLPIYGSDGGDGGVFDMQIFPLPINHTARPAPLPQAPAGLVDADETAEADVAKVMGCPTAMWSGARRVAVATNQTALTTWYTTLQGWRSDLQHISETIMVFTFGDARREQLRVFAETGGSGEVSESEEEGRDANPTKRVADAAEGGPRKKRRKRQRAEGGRHSDPIVSEKQLRRAHGETVSDSSEEEKEEEEEKPKPRTSRKRRAESSVEASSKISITFPALLDQSMIQNLLELGAITWDTAMDFLASYLGINRALLTDERLEPTTGQPLAQETIKARRLEQTAAKVNIDVTKEKAAADAAAAKLVAAPKPVAKPAASSNSGSTTKPDKGAVRLDRSKNPDKAAPALKTAADSEKKKKK